MTYFQPPDTEEEPEDGRWERWFKQQERNGMVVASREELRQRIDSECNDAYAEGRKDEREYFLKLIADAGFKVRDTGNGKEFLLESQPNRHVSRIERDVRVNDPTKPFVAAWEYPDGSCGWHDFDTEDGAYRYLRPFFGDPMWLWINETVLQEGYRTSDELGDMWGAK